MSILDGFHHSCDALVLLDLDPVRISLLRLHEFARSRSDPACKAHECGERPLRYLRGLWDKVVSPIVEFLQTMHLCHITDLGVFKCRVLFFPFTCGIERVNRTLLICVSPTSHDPTLLLTFLLAAGSIGCCDKTELLHHSKSNRS